MPQNIQHAAPTLAQFQQVADNTSEKGSIVFKNGALVSRGRAGTIFSRHSSRRAAVDALLNSITAKYGAQVADMVGGSLTEIRGKGKPLRAAAVRDILATAAQKSQVYRDGNVGRLSWYFQNGAFAPAVDAFTQKNDLSEAQQQELKAVVQTELSQRPRLFPGAEECQSLAEFSQKIEDGLPCMKSMMQMLKPGKAATLPFLFYAPAPAERADIAWLQALVSQKAADCAAGPEMDLCYLLQRMPEMRTLQAEGPLTLDTVWQTCFGENPPENLHMQSPDMAKTWSQHLKTKVTTMLAQHNAESQVNVYNVFAAMACGLKLEAAVARVVHHAPITLQDLCRQPMTLGFDPDYTNAQSVEASVAIDISRLDLRGLVDFNPAFSFTTRDGVVTTIHPMSNEGLSPGDKEQWARGKLSQRSREVMEAAASLCAPDAHAQKLVLAMAFHQSGLQIPRFFNPFAGVALSEHTACNISARADAEGTVLVAYKTPENAQSQLEMTILIRPDGSNHMTHFDMRANPDYVPPAPGRAAPHEPGPVAVEQNEAGADESGVDESTVLSTDYFDDSTASLEGQAIVNENPVPGRTVKSENEL